MKTCSKCSQELPDSMFYKTKTGLTASCKTCKSDYAKRNKDKINARMKRWRDKNKDKVRGYVNKEKKAEYNHQYYAKNKETIIKQNTEWAKNNLEKRSIIMQEYYKRNTARMLDTMAKWAKNNRAKKNTSGSNYRAAKLHRTPNWLTEADFKKIEEFYQLARDLTDIVGLPYEVDHIVPLQGENVSGLHCPSNLQVIPASENRSKGNRYNT